MTRPLPIACVTLLLVLTNASFATAEAPKKTETKKDEAKKDDGKKAEPASEEPKTPDEPPVSTTESKAEHPVDAPKAPPPDDENKYDWRKEPGGEHGSQVASSEWLPIPLGAAAGVMVGALAGAAIDDSQPPVAGPIIGGVAGGFAGGAAGAWIIRAQRERDTRTAGMLTGLSLGVGAGTMLFAKIDADGRVLETVGKFGALAIGPLIGALAGHAVASHYYLKPPRETPAAPPPPAAIVPTIAPVITGSRGATGMTIGFNASF